MTDTTSVVICDAGPLIHLDELGCLPLLADFGRVLIPAQVWQEVERHRPEALRQPDLLFEHIEVAVSVQPSFRALIHALSLDLGEQAALSLMQDNPQAIFLTDDAAARLAAVTLGYRVHGTIGILLRAVRRQQRTRAEVLALLNNLPDQTSLHIRPALLQEIIAELKTSGQD